MRRAGRNASCVDGFWDQIYPRYFSGKFTKEYIIHVKVEIVKAQKERKNEYQVAGVQRAFIRYGNTHRGSSIQSKTVEVFSWLELTAVKLERFKNSAPPLVMYIFPASSTSSIFLCLEEEEKNTVD